MPELTVNRLLVCPVGFSYMPAELTASDARQPFFRAADGAPSATDHAAR